MVSKLYGNLKAPIYVYSPAFSEVSAGIRALHYLCHALNTSGHPAWMIIHGTNSMKNRLVSGSLITPVLTEDIRDQHYAVGVPPIVIYPETIPGNPLNAQIVVRWLLNYPGLLGGQDSFSSGEILLAYSKKIADSIESKPAILFLPPLDISEIWQTQARLGASDHSGPALLYAGKYRGFVGKPVLPKWAQQYDPVEIWREGPSKQSRPDVLELLNSASVLFCFENSTIITEAALLGTPVVLIRSTFFDELIAEEELGLGGTAWHDEIQPISLASATILEPESKYIEAISNFFEVLECQVDSWEANAIGQDYLKPIPIPNLRHLLSKHRISMALQILKNQGIFSLIRVLYSFSRRRTSRS